MFGRKPKDARSIDEPTTRSAQNSGGAESVGSVRNSDEAAARRGKGDSAQAPESGSPRADSQASAGHGETAGHDQRAFHEDTPTGVYSPVSTSEPVDPGDEDTGFFTRMAHDDPREVEPPEPVLTQRDAEIAGLADAQAEERKKPLREPGFNDKGDPKKPSTMWILTRAFKEFNDDQCTDVAASLTYYGLQAIFPAAIALVSVLGVLSNPRVAIANIMKMINQAVPGDHSSIQKLLTQIAGSQGAGIALVIGILGALWSASGYVGAFSRSMNQVFEVREGRPFWKLRPVMYILTAVIVLLCVAGLVIMIVSGPVAKSIGDAIGLGSTAVLVWSIAKWPALLVLVILIVSLLYHFTPNVKPPKFKILSVGATVAILVWVLASAAFGLFVVNFGSYNKTYGAAAGVIVFMLWLWLTNLALLFGAELDSEIERSRELQQGIVAEDNLQLSLRDARGVRKTEKANARRVASARAVRERFTHGGNVADRPFRRN